MGVKVSGVLPYKEITLNELKGKRIAVDTSIYLYQFLTAIPKQIDKLGRATLHLSWIFYRTAHLLTLGIKPAFVFDGPFLEIKKHEKFIREASLPRITPIITEEIIQETKELLCALGVPVIQAPGEGEAQAAHMCAKGDVFAVASQDYDCLLFGAKKMVKNLASAKKKKTKKGIVYAGVQLYDLKEVLAALKIDYNQFVMFCMLIGTNFNPCIDGLSQKNALKIVQKYVTFTRIFEKIKWQYGYLPKAVYEHIKTMPVTNKYALRWSPVNKAAVLHLLATEHNFQQSRILEAMARI